MNVKVNMIDREVFTIFHKNVMRDLHLFPLLKYLFHCSKLFVLYL